MLIKLCYSEYKFLIEDFSKAEIIASNNIKEAEILILVKDKDLGTKYNITIENVKQAFPKMTWSK